MQTHAIRKNILIKETGIKNPEVILKHVYVHSFLSLHRIALDLTETNQKTVLTFEKENYENLWEFFVWKALLYGWGLTQSPRGLLFDCIGYINILMILFLCMYRKLFHWKLKKWSQKIWNLKSMFLVTIKRVFPNYLQFLCILLNKYWKISTSVCRLNNTDSEHRGLLQNIYWRKVYYSELFYFGEGGRFLFLLFLFTLAVKNYL